MVTKISGLQTPESMTDAIAETSSSLSSPNGGEIAEGGGEAPASALDAAAVPAALVRYLDYVWNMQNS